MKKYVVVFVVFASFFIYGKSYAVRTFTKDDASVQEKQNVFVPDTKSIERAGQANKDLDAPMIKDEDNKETSVQEPIVEETPEYMENERLQQETNGVEQDGYKEMMEKDKQDREKAKKTTNPTDNLIKPKIDGSGDYKTF